MRTDQQIVDETNDLARHLLNNVMGVGYTVPEGCKFYEATDPRGAMAWQHAVSIMEMITKTEVQDALNSVLDARLTGTLAGLTKASSFIDGFEDDPLQEGVAELQAGVTTAIDLLSRAYDMLDGEEDSVKEEHANLLADLEAFFRD